MPVSERLLQDPVPALPSVSAFSARWHAVAPMLALAVCVAGPALALHLAGPWSLPATLPLALWGGWRLRQSGEAESDDTAAASTRSNRLDAARLSAQVVPVWKRNVEAARSYSEQSMSSLLESFAGVTNHLDHALGQANEALQLDMGATDALLDRHRVEVDLLTAQVREAVQLKNAMHDELRTCVTALAQMTTLAREVQNIGRATHLLALNTSVEANRSGGAGGGFMVVAHEIRTLAGQSRDCASSLAKHVNVMSERLNDLDRQWRRSDCDADEVDVRAEQSARTVVLSLLNSLSGVTRASRDLRQAGHQVKADIDKIFVGLQSQDRLSQMLCAVTDDMQRYGAWLHGADDSEAATPAQWLERLEKTYTMEDQRSSHHGNVQVQQASSVEFF